MSVRSRADGLAAPKDFRSVGSERGLRRRVIVWIAALLAAFVLPFLGLKKYLEERRV
jgi:hypothetical protein